MLAICFKSCSILNNIHNMMAQLKTHGGNATCAKGQCCAALHSQSTVRLSYQPWNSCFFLSFFSRATSRCRCFRALHAAAGARGGRGQPASLPGAGSQRKELLSSSPPIPSQASHVALCHPSPSWRGCTTTSTACSSPKDEPHMLAWTFSYSPSFWWPKAKGYMPRRTPPRPPPSSSSSSTPSLHAGRARTVITRVGRRCLRKPLLHGCTR